MSARWEERQDGGDLGRESESPAGCPVLVVVATLIVLAATYFTVAVIVWIARVGSA